MGDQGPRSADRETLDELTAALRGLRAEAGYPSFSDIVLAIARQREARGIPREAARPGRTTVYDAFQPGRRRIDPRLVGEIVRALGVDEETALEWEDRCRAARRNTRRAPVATQPEQTERVELAEPTERSPDEPAGPTAPPAQPASPHTSEPSAPARSPQWIALFVALSVVINMVGRLLVTVLDLPLHLDMVGTALAAIAVGPWTAVVVAVLSSVAGVPVNGPVSLIFMPVSIAGGLVWGYGVHRFGLGRTLGRFFGLTIVTAVVCSLIAVPLLLLAGGSVGHGDDVTVDVARSLLGSLPLAILLSNVIYSVADKVLSAFLALAMVDALPGAAGTTRAVGVRDVRLH